MRVWMKGKDEEKDEEKDDEKDEGKDEGKEKSKDEEKDKEKNERSRKRMKRRMTCECEQALRLTLATLKIFVFTKVPSRRVDGFSSNLLSGAFAVLVSSS